MNKSNDTIAVTGATGYVGGRLAPKLLESGYKVRCLVRNSRKLKGRSWSDHPNLESTETDLLDVDTLAECLTGCTVAYYLVHSMITAGEDYDRVDQKLARNFAEAAEKAGVKQIIYLGGLGELGDNLSDHLTSRRHVEESPVAHQRSGDSTQGRDDHRFGLGLLRDTPISGGTPRSWSHEVGEHEVPADLDRRRTQLPAGMPVHSRVDREGH